VKSIYYIAALVAVLLAACTSLDCPVNNMVETVYSLQNSDGSPDTLGIDTMWVYAERSDGTDTLIINSLCGTKATKFSIPLSHTQSEDNLTIIIHDTCINTGQHEWRDNIQVKKENRPHFEGVDCKATYFHTLTSVQSTHDIIDTIIINKSEVTYDASTAHFLLRLKDRR
jgi:hypothetical protein